MSTLEVRRCARLVCLVGWAVGAAVMGLGGLHVRGDEPAQRVPLKKVVLFTSGVGYFERTGEVDGDVRLDLRFNVEDINDLLMSMVVQDLGGGKISAISYSSQEPLTRTLQTFRIDLTSEPTLGDLLRQIRGERVQLEVDKSISGIILGIELRPLPKAGVPGEYVETETLNVVTEEGLVNVSLAQIRRLKLLDPALDADLLKALAILAASHANDKRAVTLNFEGAGQRQVRVGYVQESPLWKTSYRLVLRDEKEPLLQGWAIVENTAEEDWDNVDLTLVSGRPISFLMDLYQSLYIRRPIVQPELFAGLTAKIHDQDLAGKEADFGRARVALGGGGGGGGFGGAMGGGGFFPGGGMGGGGFGGGHAERPKPDPIDPGQGVESSATGGELGELFQYEIEHPVSLARQKSAMLPIVNQSLEATKLSLFNAQTHAKHPLNALRLKNTTGLHLMQGPITVYDGGSYAGSTRILDLQPDSSRLVTYALDLDVEVVQNLERQPETLATVKVAKGLLTAHYRQRRVQIWTVKNSGSKVKEILIERPRDHDWTLVAPTEPSEQTADLQRFLVEARPGEPQTLEIIDEQSIQRDLAMDALAESEAQFYTSQPKVSDEIKAALAEIASRQLAIGKLGYEAGEIEQELSSINSEQQRIRENMKALERDSDLYKRFVEKIGSKKTAWRNCVLNSES